MPKRLRDFHIVLASSTTWMEIGAIYTEAQVNQGLAGWLEEFCSGLRVDAVTLRRELIDGAYLSRDASGSQYSVGPGSPLVRFEDEVASVDPRKAINDARAERRRRKASHQADT